MRLSLFENTKPLRTVFGAWTILLSAFLLVGNSLHVASGLWAGTVPFAGAGRTAMITGGKGNKPLSDPGWPSGAAEIFNTTSRIAWWEGPPFGGGQYHSECQGDSAAITKILEQFAKVDSASKKVVVLDGVGKSFWLDPNNEKKNDRSVEVDWIFTVWVKDRWEMQKNLPAGISALRGDSREEPTLELRIYTGGDIEWSDVRVPKEIDVTDHRLEAHGFHISDGRVMEGVLSDVENGRPLAGEVIVEQIIPKSEGGYDHQVLETIKTDDRGHWVLKNMSDAWCQVIATSPGYASRRVGYVRYDHQPGWEMFDTKLAKVGVVRGRVVDEAGHGIEGVDIRLANLADTKGHPYDVHGAGETKTNQRGEFEFHQVPIGKASIWVHKKDYVRPGLGLDVTIPSEGHELQMGLSGSLQVQVVFSSPRDPQLQYLVHIGPDGEEVVGSWGGSGNVDEEGLRVFTGIPPGRYRIYGRPNPGSDSQQTETQTIEIVGGKETKAIIKTKAP